MPNSAIARGQISFVDLNDGKTLNFLLTANRASTQIKTKDPLAYVPDYSTAGGRLFITPEVYVSGESGDQIAHIVGSSVVWKINGQAPGSATGYTNSVIYYDADGHRYTQDQPYALEIKNNITTGTIKVECTATYQDPITTAQTTCKATITFTQVENAGSSIIAVVTTPQGSIFRNDDIQTLRVHCDMWRGSEIDESNVEYMWYRKDADGTDTGWVQITDSNTWGIQPSFLSSKTPATPTPSTVSFANKNCNQIIVPASAVVNYDLFKCVCKDTDSTYTTYNVTVEDYVSLLDMTDPYMIEFETPAGTTLTVGMTSSTTKVWLWRNGERIPEKTDPSDTDFYDTLTFTWTKYNKLGVQDASWGTGGHKTGRSLTVMRSEIDVAATFAVEITETA